jgi:glycosyltransferase involved in cell wall biosynthesis
VINGKRIAVVLPAYNAEKTLEATVRELPELVDVRILVDDHSADSTVAAAMRLGLTVAVHDRNRGYGANQKTCYTRALASGADVVVMIHPDYQYSPRLVTALASMVAYGIYDIALGSRILGGQALRGGMPVYKYIANRVLTAFQNLLLAASLSEYHTGFRAFSRDMLVALPIERNSDDFLFDNQVLAQAVLLGARIGEISCPARYFPEASSINFRRSSRYGLGVIKTTLRYSLAMQGFARFSPFEQATQDREVARAHWVTGDQDADWFRPANPWAGPHLVGEQPPQK